MFKFFLLFLFSIFFILPKNVSAHSEITVIEIVPSGFVPSETTIDVNSSVIFINKDKEPRWPASNVHPTHNIYPEFDPKKPIAPGESWAFKFKRVGEWKFHDHLLPHMRGAITVIDEDGSETKTSEEKTESTPLNIFAVKVKNVINNFVNKMKSLFSFKNISKPPVGGQAQLPNKENFKKLSYDVQSEMLSKIAQSNGASAWNFVKDVFKGEGGSSGSIHDLAHLSGLLIYEKNGFEGIKNCTSNFAFGCYHGFLDKAFSKDLNHLLDAQNACSKLGPDGSGPVASCIHGIGHGVASYYSTSDLKKALTSCRKLTTGREYCFDGIFMEFVRSAPISFYKRQDSLYPCNMLEKEFGYTYSSSCGRNQPSLLMSRFNMGFDEVIAICLSSSSKPFKESCFDALGFSLASAGNVNQIIAGCQKMGASEYINKCIKAAAGELVFQEIPGWSEKSKEVCNASLEKQECLQNVDRLIKEYNRQVQINFTPKQANEDINLYVRSHMKKCYETDGRDGCYKKAADVLYGQFGLAKTLQVFKENEEYPEVYARCHETTHYLSRLEFDMRKSIAKVYAQCDSTCHGGCYHGTLEAYLREKTNETGFNLTSQFAKVCGQKNDYQKPIEFNECLHGMGHAAMFVTDMELKQSLKLCDTIADQQYKERCYTGVFMENSSSSTSFDHASIYIKKDDPFYPCNSLEEKYQSLCWQYQSSYFSIINKQDWKKVADLCLQIPTKYQDRCFRTIGTNQVGFTPVLATMKKDCDLMPSENFKDICVAGVVSSLSYRFVGDMQKMIGFCELTDSQNKESCFKQIGNGVLDWDNNKDVAKRQCQKIPDSQGQSWCLSVI